MQSAENIRTSEINGFAVADTAGHQLTHSKSQMLLGTCSHYTNATIHYGPKTGKTDNHCMIVGKKSNCLPSEGMPGPLLG